MRQRTEIAPFVGSYGLNLCETKPKHGILGKNMAKLFAVKHKRHIFVVFKEKQRLAHLAQRQNEKINGLPTSGKGELKKQMACPTRAKVK